MPPILRKHINHNSTSLGKILEIHVLWPVNIWCRQIDTSKHFSVFTVCEFPTISHPPDPYRHSASTHTHRWLSSSFGWLTIVWTTVKLSRRSWNSSRNHRNCLQFPEKISEKKQETHTVWEQIITLPETNSSHLKLDGWKTNFLLAHLIFTGYVSFREGNLFCHPLVPVERSPAQRPFLRQRYPEILAACGVVGPSNQICEKYCWWFRNPAPVEVGSLSRYLQGSYISGVGILPSTLPLIPFCSAWWFITLFCRVFSFVQSGEEFLVVSNISLIHHLLK